MMSESDLLVFLHCLTVFQVPGTFAYPYYYWLPQSVYRQTLDFPSPAGQYALRAQPAPHADTRQFEDSPDDGSPPRQARGSSWMNPDRAPARARPGFSARQLDRGYSGDMGAQGRSGYGGGPYRKPFDLTIPSYAAIPQRYTGAMQCECFELCLWWCQCTVQVVP